VKIFKRVENIVMEMRASTIRSTMSFTWYSTSIETPGSRDANATATEVLMVSR
jgi:hypothetical protein